MGGDRQDRPLTGDPEFLHDHVRPRGRAATLGWTHQEVGKDSGRDWWLHRVRPSAVRVAELADLPGGKGPARAHTGRESPDARSGDRKSTRLNSSHEWISYAVFCLKKKNIQQKEIVSIKKKKKDKRSCNNYK